jgi:serine-type D-Ala-D-Ala endopeptidase (penicillin-binding protein 7)
MIIKILAQFVLATSLFQVFPVDAQDVENLALRRKAENFSIHESLQGSSARLPENIDSSKAPTKTKPTSLGVITSAHSAIVIDRESRQILFQKNIEVPRSIGSITKLMTAFVFLNTNPNLNDPVTIQSRDYRGGGVQHVSLNDPISTKELLYASLISSDNSATAALVRLSGMTHGDFVAKMNESAASMGMQKTTFVDATGLSSKNQSVVTDVALLLDTVSKNEIIKEATEHSTYAITGGSGRVYGISSTDKLLTTFVNQDPYKIVAGKTGFLPEAGYCFGSIFSRDGSGETIIVVLGSSSDTSRFQDVKSLVVWVYDVFKWN